MAICTPSTSLQPPDLAALCGHSARIEESCARIGQFLARVRGCSPDDEAYPPVRDGYLGDIDRASNSIARLEGLVRDLECVG